MKTSIRQWMKNAKVVVDLREVRAQLDVLRAKLDVLRAKIID